MHINRALKLIVPREYVSRERSRRHIAANYLPGLQPIDRTHDVKKFGFVIFKVSTGFHVGKVTFLSKGGKPVPSACREDASEYSFRAIMMIENGNESYVFSQPIRMTKWLKLDRIVSPVHLSQNSGVYHMRKEDGLILKNAEKKSLETKDAVLGKQILKSDVPCDYFEVKEILDRKLDPKTHSYNYLVKFSEGTENVWLPGQNFYETVQYKRRFSSSLGNKRQFALPAFADDPIPMKKTKPSKIAGCLIPAAANTSSKKDTSFFNLCIDSDGIDSAKVSGLLDKYIDNEKNSCSSPKKGINYFDACGDNDGNDHSSSSKDTSVFDICIDNEKNSSSSYKKVESFFEANEDNRYAKKVFDKCVDHKKECSTISTKSVNAYCKLGKSSKRRKTKQPVKVSKMTVSKMKLFKRMRNECNDPDYVVRELLLKKEDFAILSKKQCLVSSHLYAASVLIKKQFPDLSGLHDTLYKKGMINANENSIQFHHDGENHWLLSTNIGGKVVVYDSIFREPSKDTEKQLCSLYRSHVKNFKLEIVYPRVQAQDGDIDCGLFAIAFAIDIAMGHDPSNIFYVQDDMRSHLSDCYHDIKLDLFPRSDQLHFAREIDEKHYEINVSCFCGLPNGEDMVECSMCVRRFHKVCLDGVTLALDWECDDCKPSV